MRIASTANVVEQDSRVHTFSRLERRALIAQATNMLRKCLRTGSVYLLSVGNDESGPTERVI